MDTFLKRMPTSWLLSPSLPNSRSELPKPISPLLIRSSASSLSFDTWKVSGDPALPAPAMRKASSPELKVEMELVPPGHSGVQLLSLGV